MHGNNYNNSMIYMQYKTRYSTVFPFQNTSFGGSNCNTCSYAIKSHDQNYYITLCISINVMVMLELKTHNNKQHLSLYKEPVQ